VGLDAPDPVAVEAGEYHSCAIRTDGTPTCWGWGDDGQTTIPAGTGTVTAITAGLYHTCAIRTDGTPTCWGSDQSGQTTVPDGVGTVTAIAAGSYHTCAIRTDGTPTCWGHAAYGQATIPVGTGTVTAIAAGRQHTCAIRTDDTPTCWGSNDGGQSTIPAGTGTVTAITAGLFHTCAIRSDGTPTCWGSDQSGQTTVPDGVGTVTAIAAGSYHSCAIRSPGWPICWGDDSEGQTPVAAGTVTAITAGTVHTCAIRDVGSLVCWGANTFDETSPRLRWFGPHTFAVGENATGTFTSFMSPAVVSVTAGTPPAGTTIDETTGALTGTPTAPGTTSVTVEATNGIFSPTVTQTFTVFDTVVTSAPAPVTSNPSPSVTFDTTPPGLFAIFRCAVDGGAPTICTSPFTPTGLGEGPHTVAVTATVPATTGPIFDNWTWTTDPVPATATWTLDTTAPGVTIGSGPDDPTSDPDASITFSSPDATATFACALDGGLPQACASPFSATGLEVGTHTFSVVATDAAGNTSSTATWTWTVDEPPPPPCDTSAFTDLPASNPFCDEITWMVREGITSGYPDGSFRPAAPISRQAMAAFLYRYRGEPAPSGPCDTTGGFSDVPASHTFCHQIMWMVREGITAGYSDGTFRPTSAVSRQAVAAFLYRFAEQPAPSGACDTTGGFGDVPASHAFCHQIMWMVREEITGGYSDGTFRPTAPISRQAMAAFLYRYDQRLDIE
jgi:hypothetical protein